MLKKELDLIFFLSNGFFYKIVSCCKSFNCVVEEVNGIPIAEVPLVA
jgi:hypothetical protein